MNFSSPNPIPVDLHDMQPSFRLQISFTCMCYSASALTLLKQTHGELRAAVQCQIHLIYNFVTYGEIDNHNISYKIQRKVSIFVSTSMHLGYIRIIKWFYCHVGVDLVMTIRKVVNMHWQLPRCHFVKLQIKGLRRG
jgi:hypothetical protein